MFELPWQLDVLVVETIASAVIGIIIVGSGWRQRSPGTAVAFGLWDVALLVLLATGGNPSWQHALVFGWYVIDLLAVVFMGVTNYQHKKPLTGGAVTATIILSCAILALLVTG